MKFIKFAILFLFTSSCNNSKENTDNFEQKTKNIEIKTNGMDSIVSISKDTMPELVEIIYPDIKKEIDQPIPPPPKPIVVKTPYNEPIKCFNPNLSLHSAIELINSGVENTQWFIVENKKVHYKHNKLDQTDTIYIKEKLLKLDWKLIDSSQIQIGNHNQILLTMQKENRICNIKKTLYLADKKNDNTIDEGFQISTAK